jgi:hypothetical protein
MKQMKMKYGRLTSAILAIPVSCLLTATMVHAQYQGQVSAQKGQIQAQQLRQQQHMRGMTPDQQQAPATGTPYFTAYPDGHSEMVILQWQLATEQNTDRYVLERSTDTLHFSPMRELTARGGPGIGPKYNERDNHAAGKLNYYRLHIIGKDGNSFYSPPVMVDMTGKTPLSIKPTVLTMGSTLRLNTYYDRPLTVSFFDGSGRMVATFLVDGNTFDVNTSTWTKGLYVYRFSDSHHPLISEGKIMVL